MRGLEQEPPNKPNFLLVVLLFAATIIIVFLVAYFVLDWRGTKLIPKHYDKHPSSRLVLPLPAQQGSVSLNAPLPRCLELSS
jgi:hypothetical protein